MIRSYILKRFVFLLIVFFMLIPLPISGTPNSLKIDGDLLYIANYEGMIEVWNKSSGSLLERVQTNITTWSFEEDGTNFYLGSEDGKLHIFGFDKQKRKSINISYTNDITSLIPISALIFDKDSNFLYIGDRNNTIHILDVKKGSIIKIIKKHKFSINALVLHNSSLYSVSDEGDICVWDKKTMDLIRKLPTRPYWKSILEEGAVWRMIIEDNKAYTGHLYGKIRIWNLTTGSLLKEIQAHSSDVKGLVSDGQHIYSCAAGSDKKVKIWTLQGETSEPTLELGNAGYTPLSLAVDNTYLYVGVVEGGVLIYNKKNWSLARRIGNFNFTQPQEETLLTQEAPSKKYISPVLPVLIFFALFFIIAVLVETYIQVKKKYSKLTIQGVKKILASFFKIEDILKILGLSSIIIFIIGTLNTTLLFPSYIPSLKIIYYFDALVRRGAFLPVWFLLFPSLAYLATKKYKRNVRYLTSIFALIIAVIIYLAAPKIV